MLTEVCSEIFGHINCFENAKNSQFDRKASYNTSILEVIQP